ncbi:hypothetical protein V6245_01530 [Salinibacterium amurskyense]|uniref:hypothetical protein n=1 Tax=Salinibacterium amurskyense TaxID=205941 RepID=UPI00311DB2B6
MTTNIAVPVAEKVAERIAARFPTIEVVAHPQFLNTFTATVDFTPPMPDAVDVTVTVVSDGGYVLEAGPDLVFESNTEPGELDAQVAEIAEQIETFGQFGVVKLQTRPYLGFLSPTLLGAPGADSDLDKWMARRTSRVIRTWKAWV